MSDADQDLEQRIRARAYLLWEAEGRQGGSAEEYWHRARELIEAEDDADLFEKVGKLYKELYRKEARELVAPLPEPEDCA